MKTSIIVNNKIKKYSPKGELSHTAKLFLVFCELNHCSTKDHVERVALLSEATAKKLKKDTKAAFFAGLLHDIGKMLLPHQLFDGHNINAEEYSKVKEHAILGFKALKEFHMFTAYCAGLHHNLYQRGYGVDVKDFPSNWSAATIKKVLDISTIISICDFVDAYTHRTTEIKDGSNNNSPDLRIMLYEKYPNDLLTVDIVLKNLEK